MEPQWRNRARFETANQLGDRREMTNLREQLPPANSIVAFEAAARWGSYSKAAGELEVTPAAISRQIKRIEDCLGLELFEPLGRGRTLTAEGRELFDAVSMSLGHIAAVVAKLRQRKTQSSLKVATPLSFASLWLMPRILSFRTAYPDIELRFVTSDTDLDPSTEGISIAVRYGSGNWPHLSVIPLLQPHVFPVCTPQYLENCGGLNSIEDLLSQTLLERETAGTFGVTWAAWLKRADVQPDRTSRYIFFNSYEVVIRAALVGQGIALGIDLLVEELLQQKLLVSPLSERVRWKEAYYLVTPRGATVTPEMELFSKWLLDQAKRGPLVPVAQNGSAVRSRPRKR